MSRYIDPVEMHSEVMKSIEIDRMTEKFGTMIVKMVEAILTKPNFRGYYGTWKDEMTGNAIFNVCNRFRNYNPKWFEKYPNAAFNYFTQAIWREFLQTINKLKKQGKEDSVFLEYYIEEGYDVVSNDELEQYMTSLKCIYDDTLYLQEDQDNIDTEDNQMQTDRNKRSYITRLKEDRENAMRLGYMDLVLQIDQKINNLRKYKREYRAEQSAKKVKLSKVDE